MESRHLRRNRHGDNLGSVKSRIQAREGSSKDEAKIKESRLKADARAFRNAEGVKSRMNKFAGKTSGSPASNGSPRSCRRENADKNRSVNGDLPHSPKTDRKLKETETSRYSRSQRSDTNGAEKKNEDKKVEKEVVEPKVEEPSRVIAEQTDDKAIVSDNEVAQNDASKPISDQEKEEVEATNDTNGENEVATTAAAATESNDFTSSFASSKASRASARTEPETKDVDEDKIASSRKQRAQARRERLNKDEATDSTEEPSSRRSNKSELRLERLNDTSNDETPSRRRRRARNALGSAKSSASSSLVSTPDVESPTVKLSQEEQKSPPKTPDSPVAAPVQTDSPTREEPQEAAPASPEVENHVVDDVESSQEQEPEEPAITNEPESADVYPDVNDSLPTEDSVANGTQDDESQETEEKENASEEKPEEPTEAEQAPAEEPLTAVEPQTKEVEYTTDNLNECKDLSVLEKMLDAATDSDARRKIRAAIRALKRAAEIKPQKSTETKPTKAKEPIVSVNNSVDKAEIKPQKSTETKPTKAEEPIVSVNNSMDKEPPTEEVEYTIDNIGDCKDLSVLDKMLDSASDYDVRRKIRAAIRALKRAGVVAKPKETPTSKWQNKTTKTEVTTKTDKSTGRTTTTTRTEVKTSRVQKSGLSSTNGEKENKTPPVDPKSLAEKYGLSEETKSDKAGSKKVGSIFDREEETPRKSGSRMDTERRQAERKREMMRNRAPPSSTASKDARKKFVAKLEDETGSPKVGNGMNAAKSPTSVVPNAKNVKNMLLRWCQVKTRGYENVDITNYSTSWANGMAFCALTHNFFPDAFDFEKLDPSNRAENFQLAFDTAEQRGEIPPLLDVVDLVRMDEPDWKCVYTYLTEFYKHIKELGMT